MHQHLIVDLRVVSTASPAEVLVHPRLLRRLGSRPFGTLRIAAGSAPTDAAVCVRATPSSDDDDTANHEVIGCHPWVLAALGATSSATAVAAALEPSSGQFARLSRVRVEIHSSSRASDRRWPAWERDLVAAALVRQCSGRTLARNALLAAVVANEVVVFRATSVLGEAPPLTPAQQVRATVTAIWTKHAPQKLLKIDAVLLKYAGREDVMIAALRRKYGESESPASSSPSPPPLDVEVEAGISNWATRYDVSESRTLPSWMAVQDLDAAAAVSDADAAGAAADASLAPRAEVREAVDLLSWSLLRSAAADDSSTIAARAVAFGALVEGGAGAGKTTTLCAISAAIARRCDARVVALSSLRLAIAYADEVAACDASGSPLRPGASTTLRNLNEALLCLGNEQRTVLTIDDVGDVESEPALVGAIVAWLEKRSARVCVVAAGNTSQLRSGMALASVAGGLGFVDLFDVVIALGSGSSVDARRRVIETLAAPCASSGSVGRRGKAAAFVFGSAKEREQWVRHALFATKGRSAKGVAALCCAAELAALGESRRCCAEGETGMVAAASHRAHLDAVGRVCVARASITASKAPSSGGARAAADTSALDDDDADGAPRRVGWGSVGGLDEVKARLTQLVQWQWEQPAAMKRMGIDRTSGILLHGPSGCGKSLIATALSAECAVNFIEVNAAGLFSQFLGESERNLREVFRDARSKAPCILFFDEVDCIAARRDGEDSAADGGGVGNRLLSTLLNEMDGVDSDRSGVEGGIVVLGATNRPDAIDAALMRPGRFDQLLFVGPPTTAEAQRGILEIHTASMALAPDVDLHALASRYAAGLTGSDLEAACSEAAMEALRDDLSATAVGMRHFELVLSYQVAKEQ